MINPSVTEDGGSHGSKVLVIDGSRELGPWLASQLGCCLLLIPVWPAIFILIHGHPLIVNIAICHPDQSITIKRYYGRGPLERQLQFRIGALATYGGSGDYNETWLKDYHHKTVKVWRARYRDGHLVYAYSISRARRREDKQSVNLRILFEIWQPLRHSRLCSYAMSYSELTPTVADPHRDGESELARSSRPRHRFEGVILWLVKLSQAAGNIGPPKKVPMLAFARADTIIV
ncbi:hypothetical protein EDD85DRAFT_988060 [Armillaria nabsnona]|nr:hypothetical protein EDD85DRAFT_988060 [Armillaria nabsnona]